MDPEWDIGVRNRGPTCTLAQYKHMLLSRTTIKYLIDKDNSSSWLVFYLYSVKTKVRVKSAVLASLLLMYDLPPPSSPH